MPPRLLRGQGRRGSGRFPFCFRRRNFLFLRREELDALSGLYYRRLADGNRSNDRNRSRFYDRFDYRSDHRLRRTYGLNHAALILCQIESFVTGYLAGRSCHLRSPVHGSGILAGYLRPGILTRDALVICSRLRMVFLLVCEAGFVGCARSHVRAGISSHHGIRRDAFCRRDRCITCSRDEIRCQEQYGDEA